MTRTAGRINALVPYFGGKRSLAAEIVRQLGPHRAYWEPFCGSMAVLFAKAPSAMETVNDLYADLINLARVIQNPRGGRDLYRMVRSTLFHQALHAEASAELEAPFEAGMWRAYWFLITSWFGRNGTVGSRSSESNFCVRYTASGGDPAVRWSGVARSIVTWMRRLQRVTILNQDAFELIDRIEDHERAVIYCDPPYLEKTKAYIHDFEPRAQGASLFSGGIGRASGHDRLAEVLRRFKLARVIVSYYEHPDLEELYPEREGWRRVRFDVAKSMANLRSRGEKDVRATEVLLVNGPVYPGCPAPSGASEERN